MLILTAGLGRNFKKLRNGAYSLKKCEGRSIVWSKFTLVDDGENYTNAVSVKICLVLNMGLQVHLLWLDIQINAQLQL